MADIKNIKNKAIATIDAAMVILNKYPEFDETNVNLSYNTSFNPFQFLMDVFKSTVGYDRFIDIIAQFIAAELPAVEIAVKAILLTNIRNLLSCSLNPLIPEDVLLNGFVFDLKSLDLLNILDYCPLRSRIGEPKNIGKYYYFGCDGFDFPQELVNAGDFNAFLWYIRNKGIGRNVWRGVNMVQATLGDSTWGTDSYIVQKELPPPEEYLDENGKCKKNAGILTLEYNERSSSMTDAEGNGSLSLQTPFNNCLHVFIGNVEEEENPIIIGIQDTLDSIEREAEKVKEEIVKLEDQLLKVDKEILDFKDQTKKGQNYPPTSNNPTYVALQAKHEQVVNSIRQKDQKLESLYNAKIEAENDLFSKIYDTTVVSYRPIEKNYYYRRTIIEFNTDYVMSLKLFDSKVVVAQLLDALTNCLSIDLHLSYEQIFVKNEIQKMVKSIVETDDAVVNDCFFTFSNEEFNRLVYKSELIRAGMFTMDGEMGSNVNIDAEKILSSLNEINPDSSKEEIQTIISGSLTEISKMVSTPEYDLNSKVNFGIQMNFIENLLSNLAFVITSAVISPKLYLLIAINMQLLGNQSNFDLAAFVEMHKQMIVAIIREIRDQLIKYLVEQLYKIIGQLAEEIGKLLAIEQIKYYRDLLRKCIECFKLWGRSGYLDFNVDNIDYADILNEESDNVVNNEC